MSQTADGRSRRQGDTEGKTHFPFLNSQLSFFIEITVTLCAVLSVAWATPWMTSAKRPKMKNEKWKMENGSFRRLVTAVCLLLTAFCFLLTQFPEIPNVAIRRSIPLRLAKERHDVVTVFQFSKHLRRQAQGKLSPGVITA